MEATFVLRPEEANEDFLQQFRQLFAGKRIRVTVEEVVDTTPDAERQRIAVQREMFRKSQELNREFPPPKIPADIDINALIDEINWKENH